MGRVLNINTKVHLIFVLGLTGIAGWPVWGYGEAFNEPGTPESLEKELQYLLSTGTGQSKDPVHLGRLASLYLDLGYGVYVDQDKKLRAFQEGARLAKKALELDESSASAHFLYAANLGSATELQGVIFGALAIQELKLHVHRTLELDATYAPAHHMLGRMYEELPWFLGGDPEAAGNHLKKAVSLDRLYAPAHLDLGRWYLKHGYRQEALDEFTWVVETPPREKSWIWKRIHRPQAQALLRQLNISEESWDSP